MNAYYQNTNINSGSKYIPEIHTGDRLISIICAIAAILTSRVSAVITRIVICTVCFFGFFGIIGSMDSGAVAMLPGVALCLTLTLVELVTFKGMIKAVRAKR